MEPPMNTPPAVYTKFGMTLAFAELALTEMLHDHLAERDTKPETWYALRLIAARGPSAPREELVEDLDRSHNVAAPAAELLDRLDGEGVIRGDGEVDLTDSGETLYGELRQYVLGATVQLLDQFEIEDIETTVRTLQAITERAKEVVP